MVVIAEWSWKPQSPPRRAENPWLTVLTRGVSELPQDSPGLQQAGSAGHSSLGIWAGGLDLSLVKASK